MSKNTQTDIEAEMAVLGAILMEPSRAVEVVARLQPEAFADPALRYVFAAVVALTEQSEPVGLVTLLAALEAHGHLEIVGGRERLVAISKAVTSASHLSHHTRMLVELAALRQVAAVGTALAQEAGSIQPALGQVPEFLQRASEQIGTACSIPGQDRLELVAKDVRDLQTLIEAGPVEGIDGLQTGHRDLDNLVCGLRGGDLAVVAARTSVGKTALTSGIVRRHAVAPGGRSVAFFSLEMGRQAMLERFAADIAEVDHYYVRTRRLLPDSRWKVLDALAGIAASKLAIDDTPGQTLMSIRAGARRHKQRFGLDLLVVDYLQLVQVHGSENRVQAVSAVSRGLKDLARELSVPVLAAAQLNRGADTGPEDRPRLSHLRESGSIEQDADIVILLHPITQPDGANDTRTVEAIVAKNRNGPLGTARLIFEPRYVRFVDEQCHFDRENAALPAQEAETDDFPGFERDEPRPYHE